MLSVKKYALELKKIINLPAFFAMCENTSTNLNSCSNRFEKGGLRELALEVFTNGRLKRVDGIGRDNRDCITGAEIEFKTTSLFTPTGKYKKNIQIRLKNTMGNNTICAIKNPADFYILGGKDGLVLCDYQTMVPYLKKTNDALIGRIPFDKVTPICYARDAKSQIDAIIQRTTLIDYVKEREEMRRNFINKFKLSFD